MKNALILSIFLMFSSAKLFAQNDYIVTLTNDTIFGDIYDDNYNRVYLKQGDEREGKKFKAAEILSYHKHKKSKTFHRVNRSLEKERYSLLPAIVQGKICVYEYVVQTGTVANISYFASKNRKDFFEIKNNAFYGIFGRSNKQKDLLYQLLKDNEAVAAKYVEENKTSIKNLIKIIEEYNASN